MNLLEAMMTVLYVFTSPGFLGFVSMVAIAVTAAFVLDRSVSGQPILWHLLWIIPTIFMSVSVIIWAITSSPDGWNWT